MLGDKDDVEDKCLLVRVLGLWAGLRAALYCVRIYNHCFQIYKTHRFRRCDTSSVPLRLEAEMQCKIPNYSKLALSTHVNQPS